MINNTVTEPVFCGAVWGCGLFHQASILFFGSIHPGRICPSLHFSSTKSHSVETKVPTKHLKPLK